VLTRNLRILASLTVALATAAVITAAPSVSHAAQGDCGQPVSNAAGPTATDCLFILRAAVATSVCDPTCICDLNASGGNPNASDALICLNVSVGVPGLLNCDCGGGTTTTTIGGGTTTTTIGGGTTTTTIGGGTTTTTIGGGTTTTTIGGGTTTTTIGGGGACADTIELTLFAATSAGSCASNGDCEIGTCDPGLSRCVTATELDTGWTGISHDADVNEDATVIANLNCGAGAAPCGTCTVTGINPDNGNCRCANDNRAICDTPFAADADDCGGAICNCYLSAPLPLSAGNTPACVVNRFANDLSGTVDIDAGDAASVTNLRSVVFLGDSIINPCPYCDGDTTPGDGVRNGTCVVGEDAGQPCDVDAINSTFPAPGGDGHSLDCFPDPGKNVSGTGLQIDLDLSTGSSSLTAEVDCTSFGLPFTCHCGVCSLAQTVPCASDADCAAQAAGVCQKRGNFDPKPNGCAGGAGCTGTPSGDSTCDEGPNDQSCDVVVRANGDGFIQCLTNADCAEGTIGIAAGNCTLSKTRECFLPTIEASGNPDPDEPLGAAIFCIPPTGNAGINSVAGLPGPGRVVNQGRTRKFCGGPDGAEYVPNAGCP
jgi:hypothetical protein